MTLSRVVNKKGEISESTQLRVEGAIESLGYRPNRAARALSLQETQTIGTVIPDINNLFFYKAALLEVLGTHEAWRSTLANT